jgi:hypothetical protein
MRWADTDKIGLFILTCLGFCANSTFSCSVALDVSIATVIKEAHARRVDTQYQGDAFMMMRNLFPFFDRHNSAEAKGLVAVL